MSKVMSKPTKLKMLNPSDYSKDRRPEIEQLNLMRKIVNMKGNVNKAHRAYNKQAKRPISATTFARYLNPGSNPGRVSNFLATKY